MELPRHITHYFEKDYGPLLNICNLDPSERRQIIERERDEETGFNRFSHGEEFFDFRLLADDLLLDLYATKFGRRPSRRPFYGVLGNADVVGGLYRDPHKIVIPIEEFEEGELTLMCPDHFHLVTIMKRSQGIRVFGAQPPDDYSEEKYPYFGKLFTIEEVDAQLSALKIDSYLEERVRGNQWHRYLEVQIWSDPESLRERYPQWIEVDPEPWFDGRVTHLQNYKNRKPGEN